jgi:hypothetical protein
MLLTVKDACDMLGLNGGSLYRYLGDVPIVDADALAAFLAEDEPEAESGGIYLSDGNDDDDR